MKKILIFVIVSILLLAAGCSDEKKPADFLPLTTAESAAATETTAVTQTEPMTATTAPETTVPTDAPISTQANTEPPDYTMTPTEAYLTEPRPSDELPPEPVDPWSLMGESLLEQGTYTDLSGNTLSYSYALPCLTADTPAARDINAKIDEDIGSLIRENLGYTQEGVDAGLVSVGYYGEVWGNVLSMVIVLQWDWDYTDYAVFCYDTVAERWLDTPALLEKMGIPQDYFLCACKDTFRQRFKELFASVPEDQRAEYGYYTFLDRADGPEYVNLDLQVYPNAAGEVVVVAPIVSLAGADHYFQLIPMHFDNVN